MPKRQPITGPIAWRGADLAASAEWTREFAPDAVAEIDAALRAAQSRGLAWRDVTREDFPLPAFSGALAAISDELENGLGIVRLRGFPVERYSEDELRLIFWGIGAHLGTALCQSTAGELIGEVCDELRAYGAVREAARTVDDPDLPKSSRVRSRSNGPLRFHTDRCDVIGLLCMRAARSGGVSRIVSAVTVHNEILARRPDLLELLYGDYPRSRHGEEKGGASAVYMLPVFAVHEGRFTTHYSRTFVEVAQHLPGVPRLTPAQDEALDLLAEVAEEQCLETPFAPGDMQFLNNHVIYHARTAFEDDDAGHDRLLYRLWLAMPNSRALPANHAVLWGNTEAGAVRGGIAQAAQ